MQSCRLPAEVAPISTCTGMMHRWLRGKAILCEWNGPLWWALNLQEGVVKGTLETGDRVCKGTKWVYSGKAKWSSVTGVQSTCVHLVSKNIDIADGGKARWCEESKCHQSNYDGLSSSHVRVWELDHKEDWALKNWCFPTWCWRRLLRVLWTAKGSNQSILKEINPE